MNAAIELPHPSMWWAPEGRIRFLRWADGGYPVIYGVHAGRRDAYVCASCAASCVDFDPDGPSPDPWWGVDADRISVSVLYEGPPYECDGCGDEIESAYGDPFADPEVEHA